MRQRNDTDRALYAPAADPPFEVAPGETIEYDIPVIGLTILEDEEPVKPEKAGKAQPKKEEPKS